MSAAATAGTSTAKAAIRQVKRRNGGSLANVAKKHGRPQVPAPAAAAEAANPCATRPAEIVWLCHACLVDSPRGRHRCFSGAALVESTAGAALGSRPKG